MTGKTKSVGCTSVETSIYVFHYIAHCGSMYGIKVRVCGCHAYVIHVHTMPSNSSDAHTPPHRQYMYVQ